jgi:Response regulator of the LytR/AlgR family
MEYPALQNKVFLSAYILIWTVISLAISFVVAPLVALPFGFSLLFGAISGYLFGILAIFLWSVVKYADYSVQNHFHRMASYLALALVSVGIWIGIIFLMLYICMPGNNVVPFEPLIPLELMLGSCFFVIVLLIYNKMLANAKDAEKEEELEEMEQPVEPTQSDMAVEMVERIAVKVGSKIEVILVSEIVAVQAEGDYVMIHTAQGRYLKEQTMKYFEEHLPSNQFVRVHRSCIVNVQVISKIELFEKQNQLLTLQNGLQVKASATGYKLLKRTLNL